MISLFQKYNIPFITLHSAATLLLVIWTSLVLGNNQTKTQTPLRFAYLTDIHVLPDAESSQQLKDLVAEVNGSDLAMVIINGDISNTGSDKELLHVKNILDQLTIPYYIVPGNHENNWSESAGRTFKQLWGDDKFIFTKEGFVFAGINSGPFMRMGDGHIKVEDISWLERELKAKATPDKQVLFFTHYPLAEGLDKWYLVTDILKNYPGAIAFCGHGHQLQLLNFNGTPGVMGRSLVPRGKNIPGYNIVEAHSDFIKVYEKILGEPLSEPAIEFASHNTSFLDDIPASPLPDYTVNKAYPDIEPVYQLIDTASIFTGPLALSDTMVVYANSAGWLKAYNFPGEKLRWEKKMTGPVFTTPVHASNIIIAADTGGNLYALEAATGTLIWKLSWDVPIVAKPLIKGNHLYIGVGTQGMFKIDIQTGQIVWEFGSVDGLIQAEPVLHNDILVFTAWDTHLYALNKHSGQLKWKWNNGRDVVLLSPGNVVPVVSNNKVFIVAPDRYMTCLELATGKELWRSNKHQVRESMGSSKNGELVFAKLMNDSVIAVETREDSLATRWVIDAGFGYDHNPIPLVEQQSTLYAATRNGLVIAIDSSKPTVRWKHKTGNAAVNFFNDHPGNDNLWLTTTNGKLIALPRHKKIPGTN